MEVRLGGDHLPVMGYLIPASRFPLLAYFQRSQLWAGCSLLWPLTVSQILPGLLTCLLRLSTALTLHCIPAQLLSFLNLPSVFPHPLLIPLIPSMDRFLCPTDPLCPCLPLSDVSALNPFSPQLSSLHPSAPISPRKDPPLGPSLFLVLVPDPFESWKRPQSCWPTAPAALGTMPCVLESSVDSSVLELNWSVLELLRSTYFLWASSSGLSSYLIAVCLKKSTPQTLLKLEGNIPFGTSCCFLSPRTFQVGPCIWRFASISSQNIYCLFSQSKVFLKSFSECCFFMTPFVLLWLFSG